MTRYIGLLRGINVGSGNRLPMARLRVVLHQAGAGAVTTYLQSGNVVFDSDRPAAEVEREVTALLAEQENVRAPLLVRTAEWLTAALAADPFPDAGNPKLHLLAALSGAPEPAAVDRFAEAAAARQGKGGKDAGDRYRIDGDRAYLVCAINVHESIFAKLNWDRLLAVTVTMRNWDTATRLAGLAAG